MYPLTHAETGESNLLKILNQGLIPSHYLAQETTYRRSLKAYVSDYLIQEVFQEGLTRNLQSFTRFFDALGHCQRELINYTNIARDCGVDAKTVREYFYILEDTLIGSMLYPYSKRASREIITQLPKFYLFDVGVAGYLARRMAPEEKGEQFGRAFEQFIHMELQAYNHYADKDLDIRYWRTKAGQEVDFVLGDEVGIEAKGTDLVKSADLKGMAAFMDECRPRRGIVVCNEKEPRRCGSISVMPWRLFLNELWSGKIVT